MTTAPALVGVAEKPTIVESLSAVMSDVRAVRKEQRNTTPGASYMFRGIDAVVNAVGPALREHGVVVLPEVLSCVYDEVTTTQGKTQTACRVQVAYIFHGPAGDHLTAITPGEAWDSGDKATAKAMSVAFRTALLQALALPTDESDPDEHTYERAESVPEHSTVTEPAEEIAPLLERIRALAAETGVAPADVLLRFAAAHEGLHITRATADQLSPVLGELTARKARMEQDAAAEEVQP